MTSSALLLACCRAHGYSQLEGKQIDRQFSKPKTEGYGKGIIPASVGG